MRQTFELAAGKTNDSIYLAVGGAGVVTKLQTAISQSATPAVRSPVPSMVLFDLKKLIANLDLAGIPGAGEWAEQVGKLNAPVQVRWSTVPIKNAGIYRLQLSSGVVFAFAPRAAASDASFDPDPFGENAAPGGSDPFDAGR